MEFINRDSLVENRKVREVFSERKRHQITHLDRDQALTQQSIAIAVSRVLQKQLEKLGRNVEPSVHPKGDPFHSPDKGLILSRFDLVYNEITKIMLDARVRIVNARRSEHFAEFKSYLSQTVYELYVLIEILSNPENQMLVDSITGMKINGKLCNLLAKVTNLLTTSNVDISNFIQHKSFSLRRSKEIFADSFNTIATVRHEKLKAGSEEYPMSDIMRRGIGWDHLPVIIERELDIAVYSLIEELLVLDKQERGLVSLQKLLTLILMHNDGVTKLLHKKSIRDVQDSQYSSRRSMPQTAADIVDNEFADFFNNLTHIVSKYINMYQMSVTIEATSPTQAREKTKPSIASTLEFGPHTTLVELTKRITNLAEVHDLMKIQYDLGRKVIFAPDGSVFLNDVAEEVKGESMICIVFKDGRKHEIFCRFDSVTKQYKYNLVLAELNEYDWDEIQSVLINIDHHTPQTFITPNSSSKTRDLFPEFVEMMSKKGFIRDSEQLVVVLEPVRFSDDDVALSTLIARKTWDAQIKKSKGEYENFKNILTHQSFAELTAVECITDIFMGCPPVEHQYYGSGGVLNFAQLYGVDPFVSSFFSGFNSWPLLRQHQAYNLLMTLIIKTEIFSEFYGKITGSHHIDNLGNVAEAMSNSWQRIEYYCRQGYTNWLREIILQSRQENLSIQQFVDDHIRGVLSGERISSVVGNETFEIIIMDKTLSQPEVALFELFRQIIEFGNNQDETSPINFPPMIRYQGTHAIYDSATINPATLSVNIVTEPGVILEGKKAKSNKGIMSMLTAKIAIIGAHRMLSSIRGGQAQSVIRPEIANRGGTHETGTIVTYTELVWFFKLMIQEASVYFEQLWSKADAKFDPAVDFKAHADAYFLKQELIKLYEKSSETKSLADLTVYLTIIANTILAHLIKSDKLIQLNTNFHTRITMVEDPVKKYDV